MKPSPFDHRQDHELGDALREALSGSDESKFVQSVVDGAASFQDRVLDGNDWWEVLGAWARPGLAAAAIGMIAAVALWWSGIGGPPAGSSPELADPLLASEEIPAVYLASQPPDLNDILALELGN